MASDGRGPVMRGAPHPLTAWPPRRRPRGRTWLVGLALLAAGCGTAPRHPPSASPAAGEATPVSDSTAPLDRSAIIDRRFPLRAITLADTTVSYGDPRLEPLVHELRLRGANTITLLNDLFQDPWDEPGEPIAPGENHRSRQLRRQIQMVRQAGMQVMVKAALTTDELVDHWHGQVRMHSVADWRTFFDNYALYIETLARLASEEGADGLVIGNELKAIAATRTNEDALERYLEELAYYLSEPHPVTHKPYRYERERALEALDMLVGVAVELAPVGSDARRAVDVLRQHDLRDGDVVQGLLDDPGHRTSLRTAMTLERDFLYGRWVELIARARAVATPDLLLTYAANFDNFHNVRFWPLLDFVGINAYFEADPEGRQRFVPVDGHRDLFREGWEISQARITDFLASAGLEDKKLVFTELGYINLDLCATQGWNYGQEPLIVWRDGEPEILARTADERPIDLRERADVFQAIADTNRAERWLDGIMLWRVDTVPDRDPYTVLEPFSVFTYAPSADPAGIAIRNLFDSLGPAQQTTDDEGIGHHVLFGFLAQDGRVHPMALRRLPGVDETTIAGFSAPLARAPFVRWIAAQPATVRAGLARLAWQLEGLVDTVDDGIRAVIADHPDQLHRRHARVLTERLMRAISSRYAVDPATRAPLEAWLRQHLVSTLLDDRKGKRRPQIVQRAVLHLQTLRTRGALTPIAPHERIAGP